jgi:hypothetical protein
MIHCSRVLIIIVTAVMLFSPKGFSQMAPDSEPCVVKAENFYTGSSTLHYGDLVKVSVRNSGKLSHDAAYSDKPFTLYINELPMHGVTAQMSDPVTGTAFFSLLRDSASNSSWNAFSRFDRNAAVPVSVSIGREGVGKLKTLVKSVQLVMYNPSTLWIMAIALLFVIAVFYVLAWKTEIIRDPSASEKHPFSMAKSQLAFWTLIVIFSFLYLWIITGVAPFIGGSTLILLGISIGTTLGAKVIDASQKDMERHQDQLSKGWLFDVLSDGAGINIHRFQMLLWTIVMGIYFIHSVFYNLEIPQISDAFLALMGISSGAYVGLKIPENNAKPKDPATPQPSENDNPAVG